MDERTRLELAASDARFSVRSFTIEEHLGRPFEVRLVTVSERDDVDLDQIVGRGASFRIETGRVSCPSRAYTGFCSHAELTAVESTGVSTYALHIVPSLWRTHLRLGARIYQHKSPIEIVRDLLAEWDIHPALALDAAAYAALEYRVQYAESDFAFVSRTLEEAGVTYYFRQPDPDEENATSLLCLTDQPEHAPARASLLRFFADASTASPDLDLVTALTVGRRPRPGRLTLHDHDFRLPSDLELTAEARVDSPVEDRYEHFVYAPGAMLIEPRGEPARSDAAYGGDLALRRLSAARLGARSVTFTTNAYDLGAGTVFGVDGHPHPLLSSERRLLVTRQVISGDVSMEWTITGEAVFADEPYRPALVTPRPTIAGLMSALVVGPPGEEIHTDPMGRVKVVFYWDRRARSGSAQAGESSSWIRVSQGWAGKGFGLFALPRVGDEVLVDFLGGDPDQPIIVGRVHNASAPTTYRLPEHKTRSSWRSDSSPGSGGYNEISFEDSKGHERLFVQAERDLETVVKAEERRTVARARTTRVSGDDTLTVGGDEATEVEGNRSSRVSGFDSSSAEGGSSLSSGRAGLSMRPDGSIALSNGQASIVLSGPNVFIDADAHVRVTAGEVAALFGGEVHVDGRPNVFINSKPAAQPAPLRASARPDAAFTDTRGRPVQVAPRPGVAPGSLDDPGGYDEVGLDPEEEKFQDDLVSLPDVIRLPASVNEQLRQHAYLAMIPGPPYLLLDNLKSKAEMLRDNLRERAELARERAEELLVDLSARVEAAKQQVVSQIDGLRARAEGIRDRTLAQLESIRARALAAKARVVEGVQNIQAQVAESAAAIHARVDAAKAQIVARVESIKTQLLAQREALVARFDAMKEQVRAIPRAMVESTLRQIEALKMEGLAIVDSLKSTVQQLADDAKAMVESIEEELGLMKEEIASAVEDMKESAKAAADEIGGAVDELKSALGLGGEAPPGGEALPDAGAGAGRGRLPGRRGAGEGAGGLAGKRRGAGLEGRDPLPDDPTGAGRERDPSFLERARDAGEGADGQSRGASPSWLDRAKGARGEASGGDGLARRGAERTSPLAAHAAMTRSGGFGGDEIGRAVNDTHGATFLQSPTEGQLMVVRTAGARELDPAALGSEVVDAQMEGQPVSASVARRLGNEGYAVYERPWGNFEGDFVKVATTVV